MEGYLNLLKDVMLNGIAKEDRTGVGTLSCFGRQIRFDLNQGFPLVTTKKIHLKSIIYELLWFLRGDTNTDYLHTHKVHIWDEWANEHGDLGPIYGKQWRSWDSGEKTTTIDQIKQLIDQLKNNPYSRRHIVSAWNVGQLEEMMLLPCHCLFQFYVARNQLSCQLYQRSADIFLGVPFNIASYALLTQMIAQVVGLGLGEFVHTFGDVHLYKNHMNQAKEQLSRKAFPLCKMHINSKVRFIDDFEYNDFTVENYQSHPSIKAPVAV